MPRENTVARTDRLCEHQVSLLATFKTLNVARIAQSESRGQNWILSSFFRHKS